jgi:mono/diheme cytochrome c family protein/cytochrome c553
MQLLSLGLLFGAAAAGLAADPTPTEFFETRVRPVLARSCLTCHAASRMGGLDMTSRDGLLKGGDSGSAIVPGEPDKSLLIQAVNYTHERLKMPFQQPRLRDEEVADLWAWVKAGAIWPDTPAAAAPKSSQYKITPQQRAFWAFQPVHKPALPEVKTRDWAQSPIDHFLLAKMEAKGVVPVKLADKRTLIRRAYFDLIGLPPSAEEVQAFVDDRSANAFEKIVDRLLASPHYGERWARYWLDIARYSDDRLDSEVDAPYANAFRYRDWVIQALNEDMPYDLFVKAQIAGDLLDPGKVNQYAPGLGFYALSPDTESQEDRVDATGRAFLALTTGCAQCHNHKFDPIPTKDYYSLLGVFRSTKKAELRFVPEDVVAKYKEKEKAVAEKKAQIRDFLYSQATQLQEVLAAQTARYLQAARQVLAPGKPESERKSVTEVGGREKLDGETLGRWVQYLQRPAFDHPYLNDWNKSSFDPERFQTHVLATLKERKQVDETNLIRKAEAKKRGPNARAEVVALETNSYYLWRDLFFNDFYGNVFKQEEDGILYYGPNRGYYESDGTVERFLNGIWKSHLDTLRAEETKLKSDLPQQYPFAHIIQDIEKPKNERVHIAGSEENLGEEAPRRFLSILCDGEPPAFQSGSGRRELAEAIANPKNPLTARVMMNRIWLYHFGAGIVRTPSDFGQMGDRPSHSELLDYLAARFVENKWSMKAMHREIMLSTAYSLDSAHSEQNVSIDPENRLLWRANKRRLDVEALRDALLAASDELDLKLGGKPEQLQDSKNKRRAVYGFVGRRKLDTTLALFDFPNPNAAAEKRIATVTPPQQLYFLNGDFVWDRAKALANRIADQGEDDAAKIRAAYRRVFARDPQPAELKLGLEFVRDGGNRWVQFARALLSSNEFLFVN